MARRVRSRGRAVLLVLAALCVAILVTAPQAQERAMPAEQPARSQNVALTVGQSYTLELPGHGSAGYVWEVTVEGDAASVAISRTTGPAPPPPAPGGPPPSSYSVADIFVVQGRAPGKAIIRLERRRPWEKGTPPRESVVLTVVVTTT